MAATIENDNMQRRISFIAYYAVCVFLFYLQFFLRVPYSPNGDGLAYIDLAKTNLFSLDFFTNVRLFLYPAFIKFAGNWKIAIYLQTLVFCIVLFFTFRSIMGVLKIRSVVLNVVAGVWLILVTIFPAHAFQHNELMPKSLALSMSLGVCILSLAGTRQSLYGIVGLLFLLSFIRGECFYFMSCVVILFFVFRKKLPITLRDCLVFATMLFFVFTVSQITGRIYERHTGQSRTMYNLFNIFQERVLTTDVLKRELLDDFGPLPPAAIACAGYNVFHPNAQEFMSDECKDYRKWILQNGISWLVKQYIRHPSALWHLFFSEYDPSLPEEYARQDLSLRALFHPDAHELYEYGHWMLFHPVPIFVVVQRIHNFWLYMGLFFIGFACLLFGKEHTAFYIVFLTMYVICYLTVFADAIDVFRHSENYIQLNRYMLIPVLFLSLRTREPWIRLRNLLVAVLGKRRTVRT